MPGLHTPLIFIHVSGTWTILVENLKTACVKMRLKKSPDTYTCKKLHSFTVLCLLYHCVTGGQAQNQAEEILFK